MHKPPLRRQYGNFKNITKMFMINVSKKAQDKCVFCTVREATYQIVRTFKAV